MISGSIVETVTEEYGLKVETHRRFRDDLIQLGGRTERFLVRSWPSSTRTAGAFTSGFQLWIEEQGVAAERVVLTSDGRSHTRILDGTAVVLYRWQEAGSFGPADDRDHRAWGDYCFALKDTSPLCHTWLPC